MNHYQLLTKLTIHSSPAPPLPPCPHRTPPQTAARASNATSIADPRAAANRRPGQKKAKDETTLLRRVIPLLTMSRHHRRKMTVGGCPGEGCELGSGAGSHGSGSVIMTEINNNLAINLQRNTASIVDLKLLQFLGHPTFCTALYSLYLGTQSITDTASILVHSS